MGVVDAVWASDLVRARHTAEVLAAATRHRRARRRAAARAPRRAVAGPHPRRDRRGWPGYLAERRRPEGYEDDAACSSGRSPRSTRSRTHTRCDVAVVAHGGVVGTVERHLGGARDGLIPNLSGRWLDVTSTAAGSSATGSCCSARTRSPSPAALTPGARLDRRRETARQRLVDCPVPRARSAPVPDPDAHSSDGGSGHAGSGHDGLVGARIGTAPRRRRLRAPRRDARAAERVAEGYSDVQRGRHPPGPARTGGRRGLHPAPARRARHRRHPAVLRAPRPGRPIPASSAAARRPVLRRPHLGHRRRPRRPWSSTGGRRWPSPSTGPPRSSRWASPAAATSRPTAASSLGLDDEVFDADAVTDADGLTVVGEGALLAALDRERTGRMRDIVATIQAEQDEAIRAELTGVLIVSGGPGTGKTAVALHRAAYLLYTYRKRLASQGVLLVGPSPIFLRYIDEVLPVARRGRGHARRAGVAEAAAHACAPRSRGRRRGQGRRAAWRGSSPHAVARPRAADAARRRRRCSTATCCGCAGATRRASSSARARAAARTTSGARTSPAWCSTTSAASTSARSSAEYRRSPGAPRRRPPSAARARAAGRRGRRASPRRWRAASAAPPEWEQELTAARPPAARGARRARAHVAGAQRHRAGPRPVRVRGARALRGRPACCSPSEQRLLSASARADVARRRRGPTPTSR